MTDTNYLYEYFRIHSPDSEDETGTSMQIDSSQEEADEQ